MRLAKGLREPVIPPRFFTARYLRPTAARLPSIPEDMTNSPSPQQFAEIFRSYIGYAVSSYEMQAEMLEAATSDDLAALNANDLAHLFASLDPGIRLAAFRAAGRVSRAAASSRAKRSLQRVRFSGADRSSTSC